MIVRFDPNVSSLSICYSLIVVLYLCEIPFFLVIKNSHLSILKGIVMIKTIRIASVVVGVGALVFTVLPFAEAFFTKKSLEHGIIWELIYQWPLIYCYVIPSVLRDPLVLLGLPMTVYLFLLVLVSAPICAALLSKPFGAWHMKWIVALVLSFPFLLLVLVAFGEKWFNRRRIERLTAKAAELKEEREYDLLYLYSKGFVRVQGMGESITRIYGEIENLTGKTIRVVIKSGTYFISSGGHQNMATTTQYKFTLYPCSTEHHGINAVCINANRPIPREKDRFCGVARVSDEVARFLEASKNEDPMVIQAGVWMLTDNYSRDDVINHLILKDNRGNTWHPVTHEHCDRAQAILKEISTTHRLRRNPTPSEENTVSYNSDTYAGKREDPVPIREETVTTPVPNYCPRCKLIVNEPSFSSSVVDYARFWRGVCPSCETPLLIRKR